MTKKVRYCDVCNNEIPSFSKRYRYTKIDFLPYVGETLYSYDMCSDCRSKFDEFVKRSVDNGNV